MNYSLLICEVPHGKADRISAAAVNAGSFGGSVCMGRKISPGFFASALGIGGSTVDLLYIVVESDKKDAICTAIKKECENIKNDNKKVKLVIICVAILVISLVGITYAFFNYTRTGTANTISVGRIYFNTSQDNTISLTNIFPTDSIHLDNTNSSTVIVNITGDTEYSEGIEYKVSIVDVHNTVNNKELPISFSVEANDLGTPSNTYYSSRGSTSNVYNLVEQGHAYEDEIILVGYIKPDTTGVNGSINITAYIDKDEVAISDTVSRIENDNLIYGETGGDWIAGRTVFTTNEWNSITGNNALSFKIQVEANEGIWVEEPTLLVLKNLKDIQAWKDIRANVTSIEFSTDSEIPANAITSFDATDLTSDGPVTVYTLDDGLGNNTVKVIICADDVIYAPENSSMMFGLTSSLQNFNSINSIYII